MRKSLVSDTISAVSYICFVCFFIGSFSSTPTIAYAHVRPESKGLKSRNILSSELFVDFYSPLKLIAKHQGIGWFRTQQYAELAPDARSSLMCICSNVFEAPERMIV